MDISCAFATSLDTPAHVQRAEELGYRRAWLYDSPAIYPDVWAMLALCADRTRTIGLGPAVLVPNLRHVMTNAAAIATLEALAPGRTAVAIGTGFTGRLVLGQRPLSWATTERYVDALQRLLRGERVTWDGKPIEMLHLDGFGKSRPVDVPIVLAANGPMGLAVADQLDVDGIFFTHPLTVTAGYDWAAALLFGTVLDEGEDPGSPRVIEAAGHGAAVVYHGMYDGAGGGAGVVDGLPGGETWRESVEASEPEGSRHLAAHRGHIVELNEHDRKVIDGAAVTSFTFTGTAAELRPRLDAFADAGLTEVAYQPAGPDIPRELEAFWKMANH